MQQFQKVLLRKTFVGCKYALVEEILKKILRLQVLIAKFRFCNHPQRKMHPVFCIFMHPSNEALKRKGSLYILGPESESLCKRLWGPFRVSIIRVPILIIKLPYQYFQGAKCSVSYYFSCHACMYKIYINTHFKYIFFQVYLLVSINSGTVKVRNCGLGTHADQTAEMVRNQSAFHKKGVIFSIVMF